MSTTYNRKKPTGPIVDSATQSAEASGKAAGPDTAVGTRRSCLRSKAKFNKIARATPATLAHTAIVSRKVVSTVWHTSFQTVESMPSLLGLIAQSVRDKAVENYRKAK